MSPGSSTESYSAFSDIGLRKNPQPEMVENGERKICDAGLPDHQETSRQLDSHWLSYQQKGAGRPKTVITEEAKAAATEAFQRSPKKSIRQYQRESGVHYGSVQRLLKEMNWPPWKPHFVQALSCENYDIRMEFSESLLAWIQEEPNL
ncbi:hypothetical protein ANN_07464 [Periplaneta americana]|uniref:Uncharacterized protein n=1 Tax=Periplaneta americana TaxID=6978 RepID=A0ABQ8T0A1_PERAM|nr:hypothetical protein ANN_07464 [Periplaneta americana]